MDRVCAIAVASGLVLLVAVSCWASFAGTDLYLPSVGRGPGSAGSQWYTTVWLHNPGEVAVNLQLLLLLRGTSNPDPPIYSLSLAAGETLRLDNPVEQLFGLDNAFGALRIIAETRVLVSSRIYSQPVGSGAEQSVGQYLGAMPASFAIATGQSTELLGVYQTNPVGSSPFRYNFGFVETAGESVAVRVTVRSAQGERLHETVYKLGPHGVAQYNIGQLLPGVDATNLRLQLTTISTTGRIIAFGSSLANRSNDPSTVAMQVRDTVLSGSEGLTEVQHDSSLSGDGSADAPLGVAAAGIEWSHLDTGTSPSSGDLLGFQNDGLSWLPASSNGSLSLPYSGEAGSEQTAFSIFNTGTGRALAALSAEGFAAQLSSGDDDRDLLLGGAVGGISSELGVHNSQLLLTSNSDLTVWLDRDNNEETAVLQVLRSDGEPVCWITEWGRLTCVDSTVNGLGLSGVANTGDLASGVYGYSEHGAGLRGEGGIGSDAWAGYFTTGTDLQDLGLGGQTGHLCAHEHLASELLLSANGDVTVQLDRNNDGDHSFRVNSSAGGTVLSVDETGSFVAAGLKNAVVTTASHGRRLLNAVESPGVWFEDFGSGHLERGAVTIAIDPVFAETVNLAAGYHVFLTATGEEHLSLLVSHKGTDGFTVEGVTLAGDPANGSFDYRVVARRRGYESVRLATANE